jgi:hypothetical protein
VAARTEILAAVEHDVLFLIVADRRIAAVGQGEVVARAAAVTLAFRWLVGHQLAGINFSTTAGLVVSWNPVRLAPPHAEARQLLAILLVPRPVRTLALPASALHWKAVAQVAQACSITQPALENVCRQQSRAI